MSSGSGVVNSDERVLSYIDRGSLKLIDSNSGDVIVCALCLGVELMIPATKYSSQAVPLQPAILL